MCVCGGVGGLELDSPERLETAKGKTSLKYLLRHMTERGRTLLIMIYFIQRAFVIVNCFG